MTEDPSPAGTPASPVAAATHADPYPYYADLVAGRPFHYDPALGVWVAAGAAAVEEMLTRPAFRVRPASEPVPAGLIGTPAGEVFRRLVRMNDGGAHCPLKRAVTAALDSIDAGTLTERAGVDAGRLVAGLTPSRSPAELGLFAHALPVHTLGSLLGVADEALPQVTEEVGALVRCVFPGGTREEVERGKAAAGRLDERFRALLAAGADCSLLGRLAAEARPLGSAALESVVPNAIGFLLQAYDATAGLIGNTLLALGRSPELRTRVSADPTLLHGVVSEVLRHDGPIQNTRRFVAEPALIAGTRVAAGETVLVLLAAANRDPAVNREPHVFDPERQEAAVFTFGVGPHACPGRAAATTLASAAVAAFLDAGLEPERLDPRPAYRSSGNARVPLLVWSGASGAEAA